MYKNYYIDNEAQPFRQIEPKKYGTKKLSPLDKYQMLDTLTKLIGEDMASKLVKEVCKRKNIYLSKLPYYLRQRYLKLLS